MEGVEQRFLTHPEGDQGGLWVGPWWWYWSYPSPNSGSSRLGDLGAGAAHSAGGCAFSWTETRSRLHGAPRAAETN